MDFDEAIVERREEMKGDWPKKPTKTQAFVDILHEGLKKIRDGGITVHLFEQAKGPAPVYVAGQGQMVCPIRGYEWKP